MARTRNTLHARLAVLAEITAAVAVAAGTLFVLGIVVTTHWSDTVLYNSDSLILPLVDRSLSIGEPQDWVFSSQLFIFPEGLLYTISTAFTSSARVALLTNSVLNVLVLYGLLRAIAHQIARGRVGRGIAIVAAAGATVLVLLVILLEQTGPVLASGIATPILSTTFYFGVILSGLAVIALTLWLTRCFADQSLGRARIVAYSVSTILLASLTIFSNPLFVLQVTAPLLVAYVYLVFAARLRWRTFILLGSISVVPVLIGMGLRAIFWYLSPANLAGYVVVDSIPKALRLFKDAVVELLSTSVGTVKLVLLIVLMGFSIVTFFVAWYSQSRPALASRLSSATVFSAAFATVSVITLAAGTIFSGSTVLRYTMPTVIFPLLTLMSVAIGLRAIAEKRVRSTVQSSGIQSWVRVSSVVSGVVAVALLIGGAVAVPTVVNAAKGVGYDGTACFDKWIGTSTANGVGSYWTTRKLQIYGSEKGAVLQVDVGLTPFAWMINIDSYEDKSFSYVVTDGTGLLPDTSLIPLGTPANIVNCGAYTIYDYRNTPGEKSLTELVKKNLAVVKKKYDH